MSISLAFPEVGAGKGAFWRSLFCLICLLVFLPQGWVSAWAWEQNIRWFYLLLIGFFISSLLTPVSIALSNYFSVLDIPAERKMHSTPVPRLGGMAVYLGVWLTVARNHIASPGIWGLFAGGTLIYVMGVVDDVRGISASTRLWGQLAASAVLIYSGVHATFLPLISGWRILDDLLTVFWLVGITNAINFLDGIDGLASGMGMVCSLLFVFIAWPERQGQLTYIAAALAGACLGFIPYNWQKARIFLGDAGATFIGFMLSGLALMGNWTQHHSVIDLACPILILGIPIFDMIYTTFSRIRRGAVRTFKEWIEYTGRDHFHHRLIRLGMTVPNAVGFILLVNLSLGLNAVISRYTDSLFNSVLLLLQACLLFIVIVILMLLGREIT